MRHPSTWLTYGALTCVFAGMFALRVATDPRPHAYAGGPVLSADGTTVVFSSNLRLSPADRNSRSDLYAQRLADGRVTLVTTGAPADEPRRLPGGRYGNPGWAPSVHWSDQTPAVSGDGRFVAFTSTARLVPGDTDDAVDVFVRDLATGKLLHASTAARGAPAGDSGGTLAMSGDGRLVAFLSEAALVPGDTNHRIDAYVKDLRSGALALASTATGGKVLRAGADEGGLALSADGSTLAFATRSPEVTGGRERRPGAVQIVVKDLRRGSATWVSARWDGGVPRQDASQPALSADGSVVAFISRAPLLQFGTGRPYASFDAYVRELATGKLTWATGVKGAGRLNGVAPAFAMSRDGSRLALTTHAAGEKYPRPKDLVVLEVGTGRVTTVDRTPAGGRVSMSGDGTRVAWSGPGGWYDRAPVKDLRTGHVFDPGQPPGRPYLDRLRDAATRGRPDLEPLWHLFPWA